MSKKSPALFKSQKHNHARCIASALDAAEVVCADRGARLTALRKQVLEMIWARHEPMLAYDLLEQLRSENRRAAPPTVYRALDFLLEQGLIHRIESLNAYVGCSDPVEQHAGQFLICGQCKAVVEMEDEEINRLMNERARQAGFRVQRQTVELQGLCSRCDVK